ncbi:DUF3613 domain-containing protein [Photobacterium ganghwense]|uniref:DUF3613 domain-containing protein n=1 Tax=Photobacterium ganghwense TaxID=320778 RepID=A0A0J1KAJ6_9GAMM|nr:DUF3613 domain-containing protein [Photobacterium ganghwense]KLV11342.1 hypothetical protein ABT57_00880 [Photobacterium ganghwense]PSU08190.1 DUF3613 domain-containing protein [Photobacterium ganghwense]QSV14999.1 DUF3613 domain-containing protein [Photobacterium ganghwense]
MTKGIHRITGGDHILGRLVDALLVVFLLGTTAVSPTIRAEAGQTFQQKPQQKSRQEPQQEKSTLNAARPEYLPVRGSASYHEAGLVPIQRPKTTTQIWLELQASGKLATEYNDAVLPQAAEQTEQRMLNSFTTPIPAKFISDSMGGS